MLIKFTVTESSTAEYMQVEGTTKVYILLSLAISTLAQPVGSVLSSNLISKPYLRSSPIFCLIDTFVFVFDILRHR